jgi:hypothetical protein
MNAGVDPDKFSLEVVHNGFFHAFHDHMLYVDGYTDFFTTAMLEENANFILMMVKVGKEHIFWRNDHGNARGAPSVHIDDDDESGREVEIQRNGGSGTGGKTIELNCRRA